MMFPTRIWLSFNKKTVSVNTLGLELVDDLLEAAKNKYSSTLRDFDQADITLHTTEQAEALTSDSRIEDIASPFGSVKTPLIVKVISNVAPETPLTTNDIPKTIWVLFKRKTAAVQTIGLEFVDHLAEAVKNQYPNALHDFDKADITLHTTEQAEALTSYSRLDEIAAQLSPCGFVETPLIVKVKPNVDDEEIIRFWVNLPKATLVVEEVAEKKMEYLKLHHSLVLGDPTLGDRFLVRPIYKELCQRSERDHTTKLVVTGTPGIGKTIFSAYYMWIAVHAKKTVVWQPFPSPGRSPTYLMAPGTVERVAYDSDELRMALTNPNTVYIVDGHAPEICKAWTLLVTSPQEDNYKNLRKHDTTLLYMTPWSEDELLNCKTILYPDLPKTLMDDLFNWYGGVPRYVLALASNQVTRGIKTKDVVQDLVAQLTQAISKGPLSALLIAHRDRHADGQYSHRVLHICRHPNNNLAHFHSDWASSNVAKIVFSQFNQQIRDGLEGFLQHANDYQCGNLYGLTFEARAHTILQGGGDFQARRLIKAGKNVMLLFSETTYQHFPKLADVDLSTNKYWMPEKKNLQAIDSLRGPANLFQMTVFHSHPIKHQGLSNALELVAKSESCPRLYFVVPPDVYPTFKPQPYHTQTGTVFQGHLGSVRNVEQWALMIPDRGRDLVRGEDKEPLKKKQAV